ncbi:MAG: lipoate--protein ligase [Eubacteriales bacterium]|nr:lipoate--protein ligase [Eubacteriales bacterium]
MIQIIHSQSFDPFENLALEDYLLKQLSDALAHENASSSPLASANSAPKAILYLWQNQNTVVIGRNQNAWSECQTALLKEEGGQLARRTTGGGAVFHDLGNLNFSLLVPQKHFSIDQNFDLIVKTIQRAGIPAERSGRNDILADGLKFSGNAFRIDRGVGLHHGTLLVHSAFERVGRYLTVAPAKLAAKGIASVRARVTNLSTFRPDLDVAYWKAQLESEFIARYPDEIVEHYLDRDFQHDANLHALKTHFASWDWRFGETLGFDAELTEHFTWGHLNLGFKVEHGHISSVRFFSDALDCDWIADLEKQLLGQVFSSANIASSIQSHGELPGGFGVRRQQMATDLAELVSQQGW